MRGAEQTLVLVDDTRRAGSIRAGWRIICGDGNPYDVFWGATTPGNLDAFVEDVRRKSGETVVVVLDLRGDPNAARDCRYWERQGVLARGAERITSLVTTPPAANAAVNRFRAARATLPERSV